MEEQKQKQEIPARYSRQILFAGIGKAGQARIIDSRVAVVGCGALGTIQAALLVRAGVGSIRIIDRDFVEESNLQRQILFDEEDVRSITPKAVAAEKKLRAVNSLVKVEGIVEDVNASTLARLVEGFDLIVDATDNFDTRFLINDYAVSSNTPWVYGAVVGAEGITFPILPGTTPCLRCIFESAPPPGMAPSCDTAGVIGPIVTTIASLQAAEALKILTGQHQALNRQMTMIDLWSNNISSLELPPKSSNCPCCARREFDYLTGKLGASAMSLCGRNSVQINAEAGKKVNLDELESKLQPLGRIEKNKFLLRAYIDTYQITVFSDGRAIIGGTYDMNLAKSLYSKYIGT